VAVALTHLSFSKAVVKHLTTQARCKYQWWTTPQSVCTRHLVLYPAISHI